MTENNDGKRLKQSLWTLLTGVVLVVGSRVSVDVEDPVGKSRRKSTCKRMMNKLVSMLASLAALGGNCRQLKSKWPIFSICAHTEQQTGQI